MPERILADPMADGGSRQVRSVRFVGRLAVLAGLERPDDVLALTRFLAEKPLPGQQEVIPAAETVLVTASSPAAAVEIAGLLESLELPTLGQSGGKRVTIDTVYDGPDLAAVAELAGLSAEAVITAHTGQLWTVAFTGFVPGFGYMTGENTVLDVPRRSVPRTGVDAGSVALGGSYSGVYPRKSPGGWQIIGHTDCVMWDSSRAEPALVGPGTTVTYRAVRERLAVAREAPQDIGDARQDAAGTLEAGPALKVIRSMPLTLIQDLGRPGHSSIGVTGSGALDRASLRRANRLVGNAPGTAALEIVDGGLTVEAVRDQVVAVAGAPAELRVVSGTASRTPPLAAPFALLDGEVLTMGPAAAGVRSYLAVRGGVEAQQVLGSYSSDTLASLGPAPLAAGQLVAVGPEPRQAVGAPESQPSFPDGEPIDLEITPGPREDWFTPDALASLCSQSWTVSNDSNRIGLRLTGAALERSRLGELPSEGTIRGAIQVPPSGQPVIFLADHPVTGGYPVIAVVSHTDLDKVAQIPSGGSIRFRLAPTPKKDSSHHA